MSSRRSFLKTIIVAGGAGCLVPSVFTNALAAAAETGGGAGVAGEAPLLVVVQLSGGNDGLNMVVPLASDAYRRVRPTLALAAERCHRLTEDTGLHPALVGLKGLYDEGQMSVVHAVGYPDANRSHFRSMEIWHTASDANRYESLGWLGRYFDQYGGVGAGGLGVAIGAQEPQAFAAKRPRGLAFRQPKQLHIRGPRQTKDEDMDAARMDAWEEMQGFEEGDAGGSIGMLAGGRASGGTSPLAFLEQTAREAQDGARLVTEIEGRVRNQVAFPTTGLGRDCGMVARLIAGQMPARVYYLSLGGFDTHTNQAGAQERLYRELGDGLQALVQDLRAQGNLARTRVMVFSEFGRRVKENANGGTDHGAAGPVLLLGGAGKAGVLGAYPSLEPDQLDRGDVRYAVDFRSVYATLLERHLGVAAAPVLGRSFPLLDG